MGRRADLSDRCYDSRQGTRRARGSRAQSPRRSRALVAQGSPCCIPERCRLRHSSVSWRIGPPLLLGSVSIRLQSAPIVHVHLSCRPGRTRATPISDQTARRSHSGRDPHQRRRRRDYRDARGGCLPVECVRLLRRHGRLRDRVFLRPSRVPQPLRVQAMRHLAVRRVMRQQKRPRVRRFQMRKTGRTAALPD